MTARPIHAKMAGQMYKHFKLSPAGPVAACVRTWLPAFVGLTLLLGAGTGCQGNGNFPLELSSTTPRALQQITIISGRLDSALGLASGNNNAAASLQTVRNLIGIPQQLLTVFATKATTISRAQAGFNLTYTSDDLFTPMAVWRVTISGGQFGATPQTLLQGHVNEDGSAGDYNFGLTSLGDSYQLVWLTAPGGTLTLRVTVVNRSATTVVLKADNHGSITSLTSNFNF